MYIYYLSSWRLDVLLLVSESKLVVKRKVTHQIL